MHKSTRNLSIREGTATGLSCNNVSTCTHFSFPSCHCQFISIMSLKGCCNKNRSCDVMWHDVWGGEGRLLLHLQIPKNTLVGRSEELYWHTCISLFSPCSPLLLSYRRPCLKLGRTALNRSSSIDGLLLWMKGTEGGSFISDRCANSCDLKWERPVFRRSVSTFLHLVEAFTYHLTKTQLGNIHSCSAQWLVLHLFHGF